MKFLIGKLIFSFANILLPICWKWFWQGCDFALPICNAPTYQSKSTALHGISWFTMLLYKSSSLSHSIWCLLSEVQNIWNNPAFPSSLMFKKLYLALSIQSKGGIPPELSWLTLSPLPSTMCPTLYNCVLLSTTGSYSVLLCSTVSYYRVLLDHSMPYKDILSLLLVVAHCALLCTAPLFAAWYFVFCTVSHYRTTVLCPTELS